MSAGALPHIIDFRALAAREARVEGILAPSHLTRLKASVDGAEAAQVCAQFSRDEMGRFVVALSVSMRVMMTCQRCLEPMHLDISSESKVAALWSDSQANELPDTLEPVVTGEETDLWMMVEEEVLLALPAYPLHADIHCAEKLGLGGQEQAEHNSAEGECKKDNPFAALAALRDAKRGN